MLFYLLWSFGVCCIDCSCVLSVLLCYNYMSLLLKQHIFLQGFCFKRKRLINIDLRFCKIFYFFFIQNIHIDSAVRKLSKELFNASEVSDSPVWEESIRLNVKNTKIMEKELNLMKSRHLIPGKKLCNFLGVLY